MDGGGVAIWYITETNEAVEELSMVMYLAQSVRTVDPELASIWRDPSRFVWEG